MVRLRLPLAAHESARCDAGKTYDPVALIVPASMSCGPQKFGPALLKGFGAASMSSSASPQTEVLFPRRQLALYVERGVKPPLGWLHRG